MSDDIRDIVAGNGLQSPTGNPPMQEQPRRRMFGFEHPSSMDELRRFRLVYLASPYSKYPEGIEAAFRDVCVISAGLVREGVRVYSPIAHTHPIAIHGNLDPLSHDLWMPFDEAMMNASSALVIAADMVDWEESKGVQMEIEYFAINMLRNIYLYRGGNVYRTW